MSSLQTRIAQRYTETLIKRPEESFESDDFLDDNIEDHLQDIEETSGEIVEHQQSMHQSSNTLGGLEALVDHTADIYGKEGLTEQNAELYRVSVESVLKASRIDIPVSVFVPSFESTMSREQYSAEVGEKAREVLSRIWDWLANAVSKFMQMMRTFITRMVAGTKVLSKQADDLERRASTLKGEPASKTLSLGNMAKYLNDGTGKIDAADHHLDNARSIFHRFHAVWKSEWSKFHAIQLPESAKNRNQVSEMFEKATSIVVEVSDKLKDQLESQNQFAPNGWVVFKPGQGVSYPLIGAKFSIRESEKKVDPNVDTLSIEQIKNTAHKAKTAIQEIDDVEKSMDEFIKHGDKLSSTATRLGKRRFVEIHVDITESPGWKPLRSSDVVHSIANGVSIMNSGFIHTLPVYLRNIQAALKYASVSANQYSSN